MVEVVSPYVYGIELKNLMERFIQHIKDRTECFDDHFPCVKRKESCDRQHVWNWLKLFVLYLHMKIDRSLFMAFLITHGGKLTEPCSVCVVLSASTIACIGLSIIFLLKKHGK